MKSHLAIVLQLHINLFLITHLHPVPLHNQFSEMSQRVPNCDLDDNNVPTATRIPLLPNFSFISHDVPMLGYKAGGEGTPGNQTTWDKPRTGGGTLESIVNQRVTENRYNLMTIDALVPCLGTPRVAVEPGELGTCGTKHSSAHVAKEEVGKRAGVVARVSTTQELSGCKDWSVSGSETCRELSVTFNSATMGSPENTISSGKQYTVTTANDDRDSITISHRMSLSEVPDEDYKVTKVYRSSGSNKRIKAAATHNQSERRRRDKINQRMNELQKLVPNSSKTDKASMLDEVIQYMKQLQTQVQMMNWMKMYTSMMMPITMQQQQQQLKLMSMMMGHMGMGMGMSKDMVMNMNSMNIPGMAPMLPFPPFMPMPSCGDPLQGAPEKSATMDAYSKMAAMYQQMFNPEAFSSKK